MDLLIEAFENIADKIEDLDLVIAGGGRDEKKLRNLIDESKVKKRIKFLGRVSDKNEKRKLISEALFVCMPSRFETWPLVPMEVGASGKAIIATKIPGNWDVVEDGKTGVLIKPDDAGSFSKAMFRLIEDKNLRKKLGKNAKQRARKFVWDEMAEKHENFCYRCLDNP